MFLSTVFVSGVISAKLYWSDKAQGQRSGAESNGCFTNTVTISSASKPTMHSMGPAANVPEAS
jgi:hypothetical protein